jgi:hypothetical protein
MTTAGADAFQASSENNVGAATFTAQDLNALTQQVTSWLIAHPSAQVIAFSHAAETHMVPRIPPSLAGLEPKVSYTGILLLRPIGSNRCGSAVQLERTANPKRKGDQSETPRSP